MSDGASVHEISLRTGISEVTLYRWKTQYEGLDAKGVRRLRELEQENSRLRRTLSIRELQLDVLTSELKQPQTSAG
jgi:putative transposase